MDYTGFLCLREAYVTAHSSDGRIRAKCHVAKLPLKLRRLRIFISPSARAHSRENRNEQRISSVSDENISLTFNEIVTESRINEAFKYSPWKNLTIRRRALFSVFLRPIAPSRHRRIVKGNLIFCVKILLFSFVNWISNLRYIQKLKSLFLGLKYTWILLLPRIGKYT